MAILGAVLVEVDGGGVAQSVRACNVERCPFAPLTMQRGEPIAEPYALHVGMGWNGVVTCARVIACGETRPNRVVHEWPHVTCKRCLGVKSGAHVARKKGSARSKVDSTSNVPLIAQTDMFDGKKS